MKGYIMPRHGDMLWRLHLATSEAALSLKMFLTLQSPNETWSFQQFFAIDVRSIVYNSPLFNTHVYFVFIQCKHMCVPRSGLCKKPQHLYYPMQRDPQAQILVCHTNVPKSFPWHLGAKPTWGG